MDQEEDGAPAIGGGLRSCTALGDVHTLPSSMRTIRTLTQVHQPGGGGSDARSKGAEISKQSPRHPFWGGGGVSLREFHQSP